MIPLAAVGAFFTSDPLRTALIAGVAIVGGMFAWHLAFTDPAQQRATRTAERERDQIEVQHQRLVGQAQFERAEQSERYRKLEAERDAEIAGLRKEIADERQRRKDSDARADIARIMYDDTETRYLAEQADRAAKNPGSACRINDETVAMFRELRRETDAVAGESSKAADDIAGQLIGLQEYVLRACTNPVATGRRTLPE